jgi:hypothetical protein
MTDEEFKAVYPPIMEWIQMTLAAHATAARPVSSFGFDRLPRYYDRKVLASAKVVLVQQVPMPPLSALGLARFADFERMDSAGITYLDTYFVHQDHARDESIHFHELVHIIQWQLLGPEKFLASYSEGLERFGYRESPLEVMAYDFQNRFDTEEEVFDVRSACRSLMGV